MGTAHSYVECSGSSREMKDDAWVCDPSHKVMIFSEMLKTMKAGFHGMCVWCDNIYSSVSREFEMSERQVTHYPVTGIRLLHSPWSSEGIDSESITLSE